MPARTTRQQARERVLKTMTEALDRMIPPEESVPLRGSTFRDWEDQAAAVRQAVLPTLLEERAGLEENARVSGGGRCPYCSSERVYLEGQETTPEVTSPDGPVVLTKQHCRCRACDGSFSPSEP